MKMRKTNSINPLQASATLFEVKNLFDFSKSKDQQVKKENINKYGLLKFIFIKTKIQKIQHAFTQKIMRRLDTDDPIMLKLWKEQDLQMINNPWEGFQYPQQLEHVLEILNFLIFPLLIIESSFQAFLDQFSETYSQNPIIICFKITCFIVTLLRFIMKCTTVTFCQGQFRKYIKQIVRAYHKEMRLFFDLTLLILQLLTIVFAYNQYISSILFFCLNLLNVYPGHQTARIEAAYIQSKRISLLWSLLKILFFNIFFAHFMASIILAMAKIEPENSWMVGAGVYEASWQTKYVYAYYWATTIMMTVGFGDILPGNNNKQIVVTSFLQMFSCIVLGYNISSIGNIVSAIRDASEKINRKIVVFERMIRKDRKNKVQIDRFLEKRISNYLRELRIDKSNLQYVQRDELLSELPENLRRAYYKDANKRIFPSVMFFNTLKPSTLGTLAQNFKSSLFSNGQVLTSQEHSILILQKGKIGFGYKKKGSTFNGEIMQTVTVQKQDNNCLLNPSSFLTLKPQKKYTLISKSSSVIWQIQFEQFLEILSHSVIDFEYYCTLLHKHYLDQNQWEYIPCTRCSNQRCKRFHSVFNCAKITYLPIRNMIIRFYFSNKNTYQQERVENYRRKRPSLTGNTLQWKKQSVKDYQIIKKSESYHSQRLSHRDSHDFNYLNNFMRAIEKTKQQKEQILNLNELRLKKLLREVLFEHQTGYQQGFWLLQCDAAHDYQFYFPQDNANRLFFSPIQIHPRLYKNFDHQALAFSKRLRRIGHFY